MGDKSETDLNQPTSFLFCIISYNFVVPHILIFDIDIDINLEIDIDIDKPSEVEIDSQHKKLTWRPWLMELLLDRMDGWIPQFQPNLKKEINYSFCNLAFL